MLLAQGRSLPRQLPPQRPQTVLSRLGAVALCPRSSSGGGGGGAARVLTRPQRRHVCGSASRGSNGGAASSSDAPAPGASASEVAVQQASAVAPADDDEGGGRLANSSSSHHHGGSGSSAAKLREQLSDLSSKYEALDGRLDALEGALITLLRNVKDKARRPAAAAGVGPGAEAAGADGAVVDVASPGDVPAYGRRRSSSAGTASGQEEGEELSYDSYDSESDDEPGSGIFDLRKLQSALSENINKGYLESVKHLRDMLMAYEWHLHGKELAERSGVARFEQHCAEHEGEEVEFDVVSQLYANPSDLSVLPTNRLRLLARAIIQQAVDERYHAIYLEATNTSKELAKTGLKDVIPDSAGKVGGVLKDLLPLPGFLKK